MPQRVDPVQSYLDALCEFIEALVPWRIAIKTANVDAIVSGEEPDVRGVAAQTAGFLAREAEERWDAVKPIKHIPSGGTLSVIRKRFADLLRRCGIMLPPNGGVWWDAAELAPVPAADDPLVKDLETLIAIAGRQQLKYSDRSPDEPAVSAEPESEEALAYVLKLNDSIVRGIEKRQEGWLPAPATLTLGELIYLKVVEERLHTEAGYHPDHWAQDMPQDVFKRLARINAVLMAAPGFSELTKYINVELGHPPSVATAKETRARLARILKRSFDEIEALTLQEAMGLLTPREGSGQTDGPIRSESLSPPLPLTASGSESEPQGLIDNQERCDDKQEPSEEIKDEKWLARNLRLKNKARPARLVDYMVGKEDADSDDVGEHVHGSDVSDSAIRKNAKEASTFAAVHGCRLSYELRAGKVFKKLSPE